MLASKWCPLNARLESSGWRVFTCESRSAGTGELVECGERAGAAVETGVRVAGVGDGDLTEGCRVADGTGAAEAGAAVSRRDSDITGATVLTAWPRTRVARVRVLTIFSHVHTRAAGTQDTTVSVHPSIHRQQE